ncbi:MAG: GDP-mannose 4,6-dehydratase [Armatimonadetes bacterium]|nr:GDP-mannose 4,6-dehydratase [Armatimonadota bacterium]
MKRLLGGFGVANCLVTGAAGFIGSHLVEALAAAGHSVVGVDNFDPLYPREVKEANLAELAPGAMAAFYEVDVRDEAAMAQAMQEHCVAAVFHLAARGGVRPSIKAPAEYVDANIRGTLAVLEAARRVGVPKIIFASSSSVYGLQSELPFRESQALLSPASPYAATKIAGEALCHAYHHVHGLQVTCLRLFTVYGPRQRPDLAISSFVRRMLAGEAVPVYGDGTSSRDYTFVGDIVRGFVAALHGDWGFEIINLASGRAVRLIELVRAIGEVLGVEPRIQWEAPQPGDVPHTWGDVTRAKEVLGWQPLVTLREGLEAFVDWYRQREAREENKTG